jgi:hypothetical protein
MALREGFISPERAARLERSEHLIQDLRRRLINEILSIDEDAPDLKALVARLIDDVTPKT